MGRFGNFHCFFLVFSNETCLFLSKSCLWPPPPQMKVCRESPTAIVTIHSHSGHWHPPRGARPNLDTFFFVCFFLEVIQAVTFSSLIVGHQQPLSLGHVFTIPKRAPAELPGPFNYHGSEIPNSQCGMVLKNPVKKRDFNYQAPLEDFLSINSMKRKLHSGNLT